MPTRDRGVDNNCVNELVLTVEISDNGEDRTRAPRTEIRVLDPFALTTLFNIIMNLIFKFRNFCLDFALQSPCAL